LRLSRRFDAPFVSGETQNRLETIGDNRVVVLSRIGDLGVSIKDLQCIIEVDFLKDSRQQELQRTGRLMHSEKAERHDIVMTECEAQEHGKRLWTLQEKGFTIKVV
jgi:superfamily II DNA or RNA helicase